jgi:cation:H+ antiporter
MLNMDILTLALLGAGIVLLILGAEAMVRGASKLAITFGISPLVVGLTVVAFSTGSPELAVGMQSALSGQGDITLGNVVGSNILNVLLVLGASALIIPLSVDMKLIRVDVPIMIGASLLVLLLGLDGRIAPVEGAALFAGLLLYVLLTVVQSRRESRKVQDEYARKFGTPPPRSARAIAVYVGLVAAGLLLLVVGSRWMVEGAVAIARLLGISELIIGLTVVAIGTSLPEVVTSIVAATRGERDIAVGNVIGSNIFKLLAVLGVSALVSPEGVAVAPAALRFDLPVMMAVAIACLPVFIHHFRIERWEGALFLGYYVAYTLYLVLDAYSPEALRTYGAVMALFVIPLTALTLAVVVIRQVKLSRRMRRGDDHRSIMS